MKRRHVGRLIAAVMGCGPLPAALAAVNWTGTGGTDWAVGKNWSNSTGPSTTDTALFTDAGSSILPADVTSVVNATRSIGGLAFSDGTGHYHTLDLGGHTLTINGSLSFNLDQGQNTTTTLQDGALALGSQFGDLNVARAVSGSATAVVDLSGLSSLTATIRGFNVGTSTAGGANGTLTLSPSNTITAQTIGVGSTSAQETAGTLHLGLNNTIAVNEFDIGKDASRAVVDIANGGALTLGTATQRTVLQIANQNTNTNATYSGRLDLGNAAVNLHLDSLVVAEKNGGPGGALGVLTGGGSGSVSIGDPAARGNVYVAYTVNGGGTNGTADFSHLGSFKAYVGDFLVSKANNGSAVAAVSLADSNTIDAANGITIGQSGDVTFALGRNNTILTPQLTIGRDYSNVVMSIPSGGTLNLGSPSQRTSLSIADQRINTNSSYIVKVDLSGSTFNAYLGQVIVAQKDAGPGDTHGSLIGGSGGTIDIGDANNPANFYVAHTVNGGNSTGTVDFSGAASLAAHLNNFLIAQALNGGAAGTVQLAGGTNTITANNIVVGQSGNAVLTLGHANTILTPQLIIGQDYSSGTVSLPSGGTLTLGSPSQPVNVFIARGTTNTNSTYGGALDMSNGTIVAYLNNVVIGQKDMEPGRENGSFTISNRPDNFVQANTIAIGGNQSDGFLNFGGGTLVANSITAGTGTATFNWTGGQLTVGTFGSQPIPFDLKNTGTGTLAPGSPGSSLGTTTIIGNYTQSSAASMAIDIAGPTPGAGSDQVKVSGSATLAGTLSLTAVNDFTPSLGQSFPIVSYTKHTGAFDFVAPPHLPQDVAFVLDYGSTQLSMRTVAPVPQKWTSTSGTFSTASNWDTNTAPTTDNAVAISNDGSSPETVTVATPATVHRIDLGGSMPLDLEVPQGVRLGIANEAAVGPNAILTAGGQVLGNVSLAGGTLHLAGGSLSGSVNSDAAGTIQLSGTQTNTVTGGVTSDGKINIEPGSSANFGGNLTGAAALTLGASAKLQLARASGPAVASVSSLGLGTGATLDLSNHDLMVHYGSGPSPVSAIRASLTSGYNGGTWTGTGINTSAADATHTLGYADGADGVVANLSPGDLLIKYTVPGDANLDGVVNFNDLLSLAQHYGKANAGWDGGDANYDGVVNFDDLLILAQHYGQQLTAAQLSSLAPSFRADVQRAFAQVPEPSAVAAIVGVAGILIRRRR